MRLPADASGGHGNPIGRGSLVPMKMPRLAFASIHALPAAQCDGWCDETIVRAYSVGNWR